MKKKKRSTRNQAPAGNHKKVVFKKSRKLSSGNPHSNTAGGIVSLAKAFDKLLKVATNDRREAYEISSAVIAGKKKRSEVEILALGGPGVSRHTRRVNRKAAKLLKRR